MRSSWLFSPFLFSFQTSSLQRANITPLFLPLPFIFSPKLQPPAFVCSLIAFQGIQAQAMVLLMEVAERKAKNSPAFYLILHLSEFFFSLNIQLFLPLQVSCFSKFMMFQKRDVGYVTEPSAWSSFSLCSFWSLTTMIWKALRGAREAQSDMVLEERVLNNA